MAGAVMAIVLVPQSMGYAMDANDKDAFIAAANTRQWDREKSVRTLA
jgi:catalase